MNRRSKGGKSGGGNLSSSDESESAVPAKHSKETTVSVTTEDLSKTVETVKVEVLPDDENDVSGDSDPNDDESRDSIDTERTSGRVVGDVLRTPDVSQKQTSSVRKTWSAEETEELLRVWDEESRRVWASVGKKTMSVRTVVDMLHERKFDRDYCQIEGKIKAMRRDFKQAESGIAIPTVQIRIAPYFDTLKKIIDREK